MRYTPVELRHVRPDRSLFRGYNRNEVERMIEDVADSFEEVWRERGELADKLEDVQKMLDDVKQREALLASTLVAAERTAVDQIEAAKREAEVILAEAHHEARSITRSAQNERERLFAESRRVETLLRTALGMVEETRNASPVEPVAGWPNRQDTREFKAVDPDPPVLPPVQEVPAATDEPESEQEQSGDWSSRDFAWG